VAAVPFSLNGVLQYPSDDDDNPADQSFSYTGSFDSEAKFRLVLSGAGTKAVSFGTIDTNGAKALRIEVNVGALAPVMIRFNGSATGGVQLSAGGILICANPTPDTDGILSMEVDYTDAAVVKVSVLG
jgi:hypothetical protein